MSQLSGSRTIHDSAAAHLADHTEIARVHNLLDGGTFPSANIAFSPYGEISATNTQAALENVDDRLNALAFLDDLDVAVVMVDHFLGGARTTGAIGELGWNLSVGVTGSCADLTSIVDGTAGRIQPATGTDAGGYAEIQLRNTSVVSMLHGSPPFTYEWKVRAQVLPSSAQDFTVVAGLCDDSTTADPTTGFWFLLPTFANDATPTWQCIIADPSSGTTTHDSGVAVVAATDYKLRANCDGSGTAYFYVDGVLVHTQTTSTNFPDTTVDAYAPTLKIRKTVGTITRGVQADYFGMRYEYT